MTFINAGGQTCSQCETFVASADCGQTSEPVSHCTLTYIGNADCTAIQACENSYTEVTAGCLFTTAPSCLPGSTGNGTPPGYGGPTGPPGFGGPGGLPPVVPPGGGETIPIPTSSWPPDESNFTGCPTGPAVVSYTTRYNAFIGCELFPIPLGGLLGPDFGGADDRMFDETATFATSRIGMALTTTTGSSSVVYESGTSNSVEYEDTEAVSDGSGSFCEWHLIPNAQEASSCSNTTNPGGAFGGATVLGSHYHALVMNAGTCALWGAPNIDGRAGVSIYDCILFGAALDASKAYNAGGNHDKFPWHEVYVDEIGILHQFDPTEEGYDLSDLIGLTGKEKWAVSLTKF